MSDRLNEALGWSDQIVAALRGEWRPEDTLPMIGAVLRLQEAARAYADLVNGDRVEPDYEAAFQVMSGDVAGQLTEDEIREGRELVAEAVRAAIGDRLLIDPPKEEE